jgi:phage terminase large subunit GpA-like protein
MQAGLTHEQSSEFAERVRYLTSGLTPFSGRFSFERFPCFRKIVDCFSPFDPTREIVLIKGSQMGATASVLETVLLYNMRDKITNQFRGYVRKLAFGQPNHALDTYVYNLAALEIAAEAFCRETLELPALDRTPSGRKSSGRASYTKRPRPREAMKAVDKQPGFVYI